MYNINLSYSRACIAMYFFIFKIKKSGMTEINWVYNSILYFIEIIFHNPNWTFNFNTLLFLEPVQILNWYSLQFLIPFCSKRIQFSTKKNIYLQIRREVYSFTIAKEIFNTALHRKLYVLNFEHYFSTLNFKDLTFIVIHSYKIKR